MEGVRASREFGISSGLTAVPAAAAVAEGLPAVIRHGDRSSSLMKPRFRWGIVVSIEMTMPCSSGRSAS